MPSGASSSMPAAVARMPTTMSVACTPVRQHQAQEPCGRDDRPEQREPVGRLRRSGPARQGLDDREPSHCPGRPP